MTMCRTHALVCSTRRDRNRRGGQVKKLTPGLCVFLRFCYKIRLRDDDATQGNQRCNCYNNKQAWHLQRFQFFACFPIFETVFQFRVKQTTKHMLTPVHPFFQNPSRLGRLCLVLRALLPLPQVVASKWRTPRKKAAAISPPFNDVQPRRRWCRSFPRPSVAFERS
jgi:hypothetical protein